MDASGLEPECIQRHFSLSFLTEMHNSACLCSGLEKAIGLGLICVTTLWHGLPSSGLDIHDDFFCGCGGGASVT